MPIIREVKTDRTAEFNLIFQGKTRKIQAVFDDEGCVWFVATSLIKVFGARLIPIIPLAEIVGSRNLAVTEFKYSPNGKTKLISPIGVSVLLRKSQLAGISEIEQIEKHLLSPSTREYIRDVVDNGDPQLRSLAGDSDNDTEIDDPDLTVIETDTCLKQSDLDDADIRLIKDMLQVNVTMFESLYRFLESKGYNSVDDI